MIDYWVGNIRRLFENTRTGLLMTLRSYGDTIIRIPFEWNPPSNIDCHIPSENLLNKVDRSHCSWIE